MNLSEATKMNEEQAREYIESILWPNGPVCPHCGNTRGWKIGGETARAGLYKCTSCREPFTVTIGTIMHGSHISLRQWVIAFHLMCSSKKGVSALQLQRNLGLGSYKSAWYLSHRIRHAMNEDPLCKLLGGVVECDEAYFGGKPRKNNTGNGGEKAIPHKRGMGTDKTSVMALVERNGRAHSFPIQTVDSKTLKGAIRQMVDKDSTIMTDEFNRYKGIDMFFKAHKTVKHKAHEFARGDVTTNTVESYFALLKRGVHGIFHHVSREHLHRYCDEFSFRWNFRTVDDGERTVAAIAKCKGKRLSYRPLVEAARSAS